MKLPKIICITGGMGSGKSTVTEILQRLGYPVYTSDERAKVLMQEDTQLKAGIAELFGSDAYSTDGQLNKAFIADQIFNHPERKMELEALVHPAVHEDFNQWHKEQQSDLVFKESALAIEIGDPNCDQLCVIIADERLRMERVLGRNPDWTPTAVRARMRAQTSDLERLKKADDVIYNNGNRSELLDAVRQLLLKWT